MLPEFDEDERRAVIRIYRNLQDVWHTAEVVGMRVSHVRIILGEAGPHWQTGGQPE